jgi:cystathionine gamma-synthase
MAGELDRSEAFKVFSRPGERAILGASDLRTREEEFSISEGPVAALDRELRADAAGRLERAIKRMDGFLGREETRHLGDADPTRLLGSILADEARRLLRGALRPESTRTDESTLRSAYRLIGALANLAAWSAPASQESYALHSFPYAAARDTVAYARYGGPETAAQEAIYASLLGFDPDHSRLLLTSSGMAAYSLIENFLLREVVGPGDRVLMHPSIYFETQEQLRALRFLDIRIAAGTNREALLAAIVAQRPKLVFVDPLTNSAELHLIDLPRLLEDAARVCTAETWFVVDGTLLSGGFNAFPPPRLPKVRVLYYESGCKYLQFGMDLGPSGVVVVESALAERFERLRRGIGAIAAEPMILPRVSRSGYLAYLQAQTASAEAVACAVKAYAEEAGEQVLLPVFPRMREHPDHAEAAGYPHLGGVLAFRFRDERFNRRETLEDFIDALIAKARSAQLPLTAGVSFGFRVPRIGAAWSSFDESKAFLRLSAGTRPEAAGRLGRLIAGAAAEAAAPDQYVI